MTRSAVVTKIVSQDEARIRVERETACGSCATCGGTCAFSGAVTVTAKNLAGARVGDIVTVESATRRVLKAAALMYLLPLLLFFLGYALSAALALGEELGIALSLCGFFAGVGAVVLIARFGAKRFVEFRIISVDGRAQ